MNNQSHEKGVLVCDDSELVVAGLRVIVEKIDGLTVVGEASNGQQAIDLVRQLAPDVVLMDISMPLMDGIEATRLIKEQFPGIHVMILTANEDPDSVRQALLVGADGYCLKSVLGGQLINAIQTVSFGAVWLAPYVSQLFKKSITRSPARRTHDGGNCVVLSPRESEVLKLLVQGLSNMEIAGRLFLSPETVKTHVRHLFEKLRVRHRTEAAVEAVKRGLVDAA